MLYIFWFLHQTTTLCQTFAAFDGCISFDSYIKPQPIRSKTSVFLVVYLLIPTSNHNIRMVIRNLYVLYIFWFLHQTTTLNMGQSLIWGCISFDSYIKPQPSQWWNCSSYSCISFDSYIKPQRKPSSPLLDCVVYLLIPTSNHNPNASRPVSSMVVYLLIPTSNHN